MKRLLLLASGIVLTSCAETVWVESGATQADFKRDSYECERDTRMSAASFGGGFSGALGAQSFVERCMDVKGWSKTQATSTRSAPYVPPAPTIPFSGNPEQVVGCQSPNSNVVQRFTASWCSGVGGRIVSL